MFSHLLIHLKDQLQQSMFFNNLHFLFGSGLIVYLFIVVFNVKNKKSSNLYVENSTLNSDKDEILQSNDYTPFLAEEDHVPFKGATVSLPGGSDAFLKIVNDRRSIRKFSRRSVEFNVIRRCIEAAGTSPSGAHTEPWTFCVIEDNRIKAQIRNIIENEEYENYARRMSRQWTADLIPLKTNYRKEYLTDAPYLILVFKQIYGYRHDGSKKHHYYNEISVSIATGILLCALQSAGLSSLITTPLNCGPALRELLDRPKNEKLSIVLPVGYAADDCKVPNLHRKHVDDILVKY